MKKLLAILLLLLNIGCIAGIIYIAFFEKEPILHYSDSEQQINTDHYIDRKMQGMPIEEKRGLLFMVSIPDTKLSNATVDYLRENHISGVILFEENIQDEKQLKQLTTDLREKVDQRILIAIDQEGGTVVRIRWDKYAAESARQTGNHGDLEYTKEVANYRSKLLKDLGVNIILGPVADISDQDDFMYSRTYSSNAETTAENIKAIVSAQKAQGIISCPKHFPGHGHTEIDSHNDFPEINLSKAQLAGREFIPFEAGIGSGAEMIMLGHIINPQIDPDRPASTSYKYVEILEQDLGFNGIVITDDLKMAGGINGGISWGINLDVEAQDKVIQRMQTIEPQDKYVKKVLELKYKTV